MANYPIFELPVGRGVAALAPLPGRAVSYEVDFLALLRWAPDLVISLTETVEMSRFGAEDFGQELETVGIGWAHVPVVDYGLPIAEALEQWPSVEARALAILADGGKVLAHCFGGCGRSGMAILRLMIATGEVPEAALQRLRRVRPCAVETDAQFKWAASGPFSSSQI